MTDIIKINDLNLDYQGTTINCPMSEGMRMVPIKPICELIDVQFKNQDSWLKQHPFFSQLYLLEGVVAADGKTREMNCLPFFDALIWIGSIKEDKRRNGSFEKQIALLTWLRGKMLEVYKDVALIQAENELELQLLERKAELAEELATTAEKSKRLQKDLRDVESAISEVRNNRFSNQLAIEFPK